MGSVGGLTQEATMTDRDPIDVGEPEESDLAEDTMTTPPPEVREEVPEDERAEEELEPRDSTADQIEGADDEERPHDPQAPHFDE
jgi:hypothetical protein